MTNETEKIKDIIDKYKWYHTIEVADGLYTQSVVPKFKRMWDFNLECMKDIDFKDKKVLDLGCRDGLFSFEAEKRGAREIIGIDNDVSKGAVDFLIPHFKSKVKIYELNLYDLTPEKFGMFDIIFFFGVLYHLRYPFWGLKKVTDCMSDGGILLLESGMLVSKTLRNNDILYCPVEDSPYEATSCTFFNVHGLSTTMRSLKFNLLDYWTLPPTKKAKQSDGELSWQSVKKYIKNLLKKTGGSISKIASSFSIGAIPCPVTRQFFIFKKDLQIKKRDARLRGYDIEEYWNSVHNTHTEKSIKTDIKRKVD